MSVSDAADFVNDVVEFALRANELPRRKAVGAHRMRWSRKVRIPCDSRRRRGNRRKSAATNPGNRLSRDSPDRLSPPERA